MDEDPISGPHPTVLRAQQTHVDVASHADHVDLRDLVDRIDDVDHLAGYRQAHQLSPLERLAATPSLATAGIPPAAVRLIRRVTQVTVILITTVLSQSAKPHTPLRRRAKTPRVGRHAIYAQWESGPFGITACAGKAVPGGRASAVGEMPARPRR